MNYCTSMNGGIGDALLYMMRPESDLGYFRSLKERGHKTMIQWVAHSADACELLYDLPYVDHIRFVGGNVKIDTTRVTNDADAKWSRINHNHERNLLWYKPKLSLLDDELDAIDLITEKPYIAVHATASAMNKCIPDPEGLLKAICRRSEMPVYLLGGPDERTDFKHGALTNLIGVPSLRLHVAVAQRAAKFVGPLSCFNCAAQLAKVPSFVIVNQSIKEPTIYKMMTDNGARVVPFNGRPIPALHREAAEWATGMYEAPL